MKKNILIFTLLVFTLTGCSIYQVNSQDLSDNYYPPKSSTKDVAYLQAVNRSHEEIGYVIVTTERRQSGADVVERLKEEAARLGADAITDVQTDATGFWKKMPAQKFLGNGYIRANFRAKIIAYN